MTIPRPLAGRLAAACANVARATIMSAAYLSAALMSMAPAYALPPSALQPVNSPAIVRAVAGPLVSCLGDSTCYTGNGNSPPGSSPLATIYGAGTAANSYLGWAQAASNNGIVTDLVNSGYPGSPGGLFKVIVATPGACPANSTLTLTPGAPTGTPANTAGAFTVSIGASGGATVGQTILLPSPGSGYNGQPAYSVSGSAGACATNPTFNYALSGSGDWGVPGDTTDGALARVPDVCNSPAKPDFIFLPIGTNDLTAGRSFATITGNIAATITALQACNIRVILFGITPRAIGSGGSWTATMDKQRLRINRWEQSLSQQSALSGQPPILYADLDHLETDPSQSGATIGNPLPTIAYDTLHPGPSGGFFGGLVLANLLRPYMAPSFYQPNSQSDVYDATNNPGGNLIGTMGLMLGANAGASGPCPAATTAQSWQASTSGIGTVTATCSIETTRTDGLPGRRQVIVYSNSGGGTGEKLNFAEFNNVASLLTLGTDRIYAVANLDVGNMQNVEYVGCQLLETVSSGTPQTATTLYSGNVGAAFPLPTSAQIALLQEARILPDFGLSSSGSFKIPCRTPPITTQANALSYSFTITALGTSASGVPYTIIMKVSDAAIRKVQS